MSDFTIGVSVRGKKVKGQIWQAERIHCEDEWNDGEMRAMPAIYGLVV